MKLVVQSTKTLETKPNNNSSDAISPNYVYGCAGGCGSYCYMKRYNRDKIYANSNITDIEKSIYDWSRTIQWPKPPNQQDPTYYMIDIGCNTDVALHQKHLQKPLIKILEFFDKDERLNSTFATKYPSMLQLDVTHFNKKPRVRMSLMPQAFSDVLEPNTNKIIDRIKSIDRLIKLGWEVHLNFSPVIVYHNWISLYEELFQLIKDNTTTGKELKSEVIFLTNHKSAISAATPEALELIIHSSEVKNKRGVMRYPIAHKRRFVANFIKSHKEILGIPIRYIF